MGAHTFIYAVENCDWELLELLHLPQDLQRFLEENEALYPGGLDSHVLELQDDSEALAFSARVLMNGHYAKLGGMAYWCLEDGVYLGFPTIAKWEPPKFEDTKHELHIPEVVKTTRGVGLLKLPSTSGADYACYVMVPPQLKLTSIKAKVTEVIRHLKERDERLNKEGRDEDEYVEDDVRKAVEALGCTFVASPEVLELTWD